MPWHYHLHCKPAGGVSDACGGAGGLSMRWRPCPRAECADQVVHAAYTYACRRLAGRRALPGEIGRSVPSNSLLRRLWRLTVRERCVGSFEMSRHSALLACFTAVTRKQCRPRYPASSRVACWYGWRAVVQNHLVFCHCHHLTRLLTGHCQIKRPSGLRI